MTSVKEFRVEAEPTASELGRGSFVFTDAYSVFDWGRMPDPIPKKGASLCTMGAYNFELLEERGVSTHYRGVVDPRAGGDPVSLAEVSAPPTELAIELTQVPDLPYTGDGSNSDDTFDYDYEAYHDAAGENYLIPLEIVFRNTVPVGSSLRSRAEPRTFGIDRDEWPDEPVGLPEPIVEFSTKYERQDRYLDREEADRIAGAAPIDRLESVALDVNEIVTDRAKSAGFVHEDGKIECLYHDGTVTVADVVGTFDENRFSYRGQQLSKEVIRQYYRREQPEWVSAVSRAKRDVAEEPHDDWRRLCAVEPMSLDPAVVDAVSEMYAAGANSYTGESWFDAPTIEDVLETVRSL